MGFGDSPRVSSCNLGRPSARLAPFQLGVSFSEVVSDFFQIATGKQQCRRHLLSSGASGIKEIEPETHSRLRGGCGTVDKSLCICLYSQGKCASPGRWTALDPRRCVLQVQRPGQGPCSNQSCGSGTPSMGQTDLWGCSRRGRSQSSRW